MAAYIRPAAGAANATWLGASTYTRPPANVADAVFPLTSYDVTGSGVISITATGEVEHASLVVSADGHGVIAVGSAGNAAHGVAAAGIASLKVTAAGAATHERYELRGEVRDGGVLVNRRVRAYLRSSGEMLGQVDTVAGKFRVPAGFAAAECYVTPIDLSAGATDWLPPTANRITSVLAQDAA